MRLQQIEKQRQENKQLIQEGKVNNLENCNMKKIKELEGKLNSNLALNSLES